MPEMPDPWPLWGLELRTPRLTLRPDDDAGLVELAAEAHRGIHPPEVMPFGIPWTDAEPEAMVRDSLKHHWSSRAACRPDDWELHFLVRLDGNVIGAQSLRATNFTLIREVSTGSWLGMRHQGKGLGKEMRAAVLLFAFDHLGARTARSSAFEDNPGSLGVSRSLGYREDGTYTDVRRGVPATNIRQLVTPDTFHRPTWQLEVDGLKPALPMLGL